MKRTFAMVALATFIGYTLTAGHAAEVLPPQVNLVATPASQLHLGMTADDVVSLMGEPARVTEFEVNGAGRSRLEFTNAIPGQVMLSDGKVSRVTLDPFRADKDALPASIRQAHPGFASSAVRRALGQPAIVRRHNLFGIEVDQWIYSRANEAEFSVFFRADRVISRTVGRDIPADLFRVDLPLASAVGSQALTPTPGLGMTASDIGKLFGAARFRVDYVRNGQQASRHVYEVGSKGSLVAITFVNGIVTEFESFGQDGDSSFQGL